MPSSPRLWVVTLLGLLCWFIPTAGHAHPIDNATLLLRETSKGTFQVTFQSGSAALGALETPALYPRHCQLDGPTLRCGSKGLSGNLEFPWLAGTLTRLVVEISWLDGSRVQRLVSPDAVQLAVYDRGVTGWAGAWPVLSDYGWLGIEHIWFGFDHLCLVVALTLLVRGGRRLVATITAFTLAHSMTLACMVTGFFQMPIAPVEALIAWSIVLVCAECLRPDDSLTSRAPWLIAFALGLLHGFGFASALLEVGLPLERLPTALVGFNLGVEAGQLAVVLGLLASGALAARLRWSRPWMKQSALYAMGGIAAFWSIERVLSIFGASG